MLPTVAEAPAEVTAAPTVLPMADAPAASAGPMMGAVLTTAEDTDAAVVAIAAIIPKIIIFSYSCLSANCMLMCGYLSTLKDILQDILNREFLFASHRIIGRLAAVLADKP